MKWARTFLAIGYTTDHANITRMLPDLQKPCKRPAMHACKQPQIQRKAKRVDVRGKRSNPKRGTRKGKGKFMQPWGQKRSYHEQMKLKAWGEQESCNV